MSYSSVGVARGILRNASALLVVGIMSKGMGLVIAILIARFLGKDAVGLYAMLFTVSVLVEAVISIGMSDSLVRDVAAKPAQASNLYLHALRLVTLVSVLPTLVLGVAAAFVDAGSGARASLVVLAISTPVAGAFIVSQAVLQGAERVLLLVWVSFVTRVVSLVWLAYALYRGAGVESAFVSKLLFQLASFAIFFAVLWRERSAVKPDFTSWSLFTQSLPFAVNRGIRDLHVRLPSLVLPATMGLAPAGVFDAANRIRSTLGMSMGAMLIGLMPSLARNAGEPHDHAGRLVGYSVKFICIAMSVLATGLALVADWIIQLFYGATFLEASLPFQLLVWVQVLVAVDSVLQQAMLAGGHAYPASRFSTLGVLAQFVLIVPFGWLFGLPGVSVGVLLSSTVSLVLSLRFVRRHVADIAVGSFVVSPLVSALLIGSVLVASHDWNFWVRVAVAVGAWCVAIVLFRLLTRQELRFIAQMVGARRVRGTQDLKESP